MANAPAGAPPPPADEPSPWKAIFLLVGGVFALWSAHGEWSKYKLRKAQLSALAKKFGPGRTVPGNVISREDVSISGTSGLGYSAHRPNGNETLSDALARVLSPEAVPKFRIVTARTVEDREKMVRDFIREGSRDPKVRAAALGVVTRVCGDQWCVGVKDYKAEADAMFEALVDPRSPLAIRYTLDHPELDTYTSVQKTMHLKGGDCLPGETLLQTPEGFKPIADVRVGDTVMGDGKWVKVTAWWDKGVLPVRELDITTGGTLRCTDEHKLFVVPKSRGAMGSRGDEVEVLADEVEVGDQLLTPAALPAGTRHLDAELAWLLGVFVADGWVEHAPERPRAYRFAISGKDGHPKEAQKRRVQALAEREGWNFSWHERYIRVYPGAEMMELLVACGSGAPNKRLPFVDFDVETARHVLSGLAADGHAVNSGTFIYSTTSPTLALQIRLLHRVLGERVNIRRRDDHGGLGTHPIYLCTVIRNESKKGRPSQFAIVKDVRESVAEEHVYDIEVDGGHRFYLPEHDVVVHNCANLVVALGAYLGAIGHRPEMVVMQARGASDWSHILMRDPISGFDGLNAAEKPVYRYYDLSMQAGTRGWQPAGWEPPGLSECLKTGKPSGICVKARCTPVFN